MSHLNIQVLNYGKKSKKNMIKIKLSIQMRCLAQTYKSSVMAKKITLYKTKHELTHHGTRSCLYLQQEVHLLANRNQKS